MLQCEGIKQSIRSLLHTSKVFKAREPHHQNPFPLCSWNDLAVMAGVPAVEGGFKDGLVYGVPLDGAQVEAIWGPLLKPAEVFPSSHF